MDKERSTTREERLAAKLRENLRRRKAQARAIVARGADQEESSVIPDAQENESGSLSKSPPES